MKYKLVIFDFDGTLANTFPWFLSIMDQIVDRFQLKRLEKENLDDLRSLDIHSLLKSHDIPLWKVATIGRYVRKRMSEDIHQIALFRGVDDLLQALSDAGIQLALVSSNTYQNVRGVLGAENASLIRYYACGVSLFKKQTKFKRILQESGMLPSEALCIGDEIRDLQAASAAKISFGAVSWGYTNIEALKALSPMEVFYSIEEIYEKIVQPMVGRAFHAPGLPG
ncbi:MAG: HAD hydrolase-like protein [Anaerolineae bacterium]|nr:HAD hydrolase-like protein [Anaerolineae bacterium]